MICKVKSTIERFSMLDGAQTVAVGLSGGADSVCLFDILFKLREEYGYTLKAVHVNHNLRGDEAVSDCRFVEKFCKDRGVELLVVSADVASLAKEKRLGLEECGRLVRYEAFKKAKCDRIAVAHTLSDCVETALFNLTRGSSLSGICRIAPVRKNIIRPLIDCTRDEVLKYCSEHKLKFVTDSSNLTDDYSRNFLRHNVIPQLKKLNPELETSFFRFFESAGNDEAFLKKNAKKALAEAKTENGYDRKTLLSYDDSILNRCVRIILEENMKKQVESKHISLVSDLIRNMGKIQLSEDLYISVSCDIISFQFSTSVCEPWKVHGEKNKFVSPYKSYEIIDVTDLAHEDIKFLIDFQKLSSGLVLRSRRPGDAFTSVSRGNTKSLKKLFNEMKIPAAEREKIAVLESDGVIAWVEGIGTNKPFVITDKTDKPVKIKIKEG